MAEPEPFEALGAPPVVSLSSLSEALSPAVGASLARHPDARPAFIGMHLLALLDGLPPPDAPPMAPRQATDGLRGEIKALEKILSDALNRVRHTVQGPGGGSNMMMRLALRLLDERDEDRQARASRYSDPASIYEQIESGDVVLIRASWLLERAGFVPISSRPGGLFGPQHNDTRTAAEKRRAIRAWVPRDPPKPLPRRQELERDHPEAILPLSELKQLSRQFVHTSREAVSNTWGVAKNNTAEEDGVEALPIVSISHSWEKQEHPDPEGRTLRIVAAELSDGGWESFDEQGMPSGAPTSGLPLYSCWGFEEVGVFWDWCSLHQAPRTSDETAAFRRAFAQQDLLFAHQLVTSYLIQGQKDEHLQVPRAMRGWPYYEEAVSMLLKKSPPACSYELPFHESIVGHIDEAALIAPVWSKVVSVTRSDGGPTTSRLPISRTRVDKSKKLKALLEEEAEVTEVSIIASKAERAEAAKERAQQAARKQEAQKEEAALVREEAAAAVRSSRAKPPPLSPSRFASVLRSKAFADGTDCGAIAGLFRVVMEDGFGGLQYLRLTGCGWGDGEVEHLARTLCEVRMSRLIELDLSDNEHWTDGEALSQGFEGLRVGVLSTRVPLRTLRKLHVSKCTSLRSLPAKIGAAVGLESLDCTCCEQLECLPHSLPTLAKLDTLYLTDCFALASLPDNFERLTSLRVLNLDYCDALTRMPNLSSLTELKVECLPDRLAAWEANNRTEYDFMKSGPPPITRSVDLSFLGTKTLPSWLSHLPDLTSLNLTGCEVLEDLTPLQSLKKLQKLRLGGCRALTHLDDAKLDHLEALVHLDLKGCDSLTNLPDMSGPNAQGAELEVVGLPSHLQPWLDNGRVAWVYDPNAPPPPPKTPVVLGVPVSEPSNDFTVALVEEAEAVEEEEEEEKPVDQVLDLSNLDWGLSLQGCGGA